MLGIQSSCLPQEVASEDGPQPGLLTLVPQFRHMLLKDSSGSSAPRHGQRSSAFKQLCTDSAGATLNSPFPGEAEGNAGA